MLEHDEEIMQEALVEARKAGAMQEVPIGAVFVKNGAIIARGHNRRETLRDATSHAEIEVIREACKALNSWRLGGSLYVTLEPCPMCLGAILQARIDELIFACDDPKAGAVGSIVNLAEGFAWNHRVQYRRGVLENEAKVLLQDFFKALRKAP